MSTLKYKGYTATVEFDPEAMIFYGHVVDLNDVITFQSQDARELEGEFRESVDDYLEYCKELGQEPERPYSGRFNVRITPDLHRMACIRAAEEGISLNRLVARGIEACLRNGIQAGSDVSRPTGQPVRAGRPQHRHNVDQR